LEVIQAEGREKEDLATRPVSRAVARTGMELGPNEIRGVVA
jgi:hypothetical protein